MNRRQFFANAAVGTSAAMACLAQPQNLFADTAFPGTTSADALLADTPVVPLNAECPIPYLPEMRDHLWMWGHDANSLKNSWGFEQYVKNDGGTILPAAAIKTMGIPNVCMVPFTGTPRPEQYDDYATQFASVKRFTWSFIHGSARNAAAIKEAALRQAAKMPNFVGLDMDDFFHGNATPGMNFDCWLAGDLTNIPDEKRWPVTLTIQFSTPKAADSFKLVQADWKDGNFRTKDITIETTSDGQTWTQVGAVVMPNEPRGTAEFKLPQQQTLAGVRLSLVSTYDTGRVQSVGLKRFVPYLNGQPVDVTASVVTPSSLWGRGEFPASAVVRPWRSSGDYATLAPASLPPWDIDVIQQELNTTAPKCRGKKLDLSIVLYSNQLSPAIARHLNRVDTVYFWTWNAKDLVNLEANFARYREIAPGKRTLLGLYMWDFGARKPISIELMKHQCECALKWFLDGQIEGMIFHCTPLCDMGLESVDWTRKWIEQNGSRKV